MESKKKVKILKRSKEGVEMQIITPVCLSSSEIELLEEYEGKDSLSLDYVLSKEDSFYNLHDYQFVTQESDVGTSRLTDDGKLISSILFAPM